ncbi:MAG: transcription antitermination protein NusB [Acholeplasmataceae bacterium]
MNDIKRQQRQDLMEALYQFDFYEQDKDKLKMILEFTDYQDRFFDIIDVFEDVNDIIESSLTNYTMRRLSMVDRAILRLATYEMKYEALPKEIAINEALELTKSFTNLDDNKQVKFNNKVLDSIAKKLGL